MVPCPILMNPTLAITPKMVILSRRYQVLATMKKSWFLILFLVCMDMWGQDFKENAIPLDTDASLDLLIANAGDKKLVLLGEASHGTHEYYYWRDRISRRLISEHQFNFIAVEGDFASLYKLNEYVKNKPGAASSAQEVLEELERWPVWMWSNEETVALAEWLRTYNDGLPEADKIGFYGMDVYDEWESKREVLRLLESQDEAVQKYIQSQYDCFHPYKGFSWEYARAVNLGRPDCATATKNVIDFIRNNRQQFEQLSDDEYFYLLQNAAVVHNAEAFYRESVTLQGPESWNSRVFHMHATVNDLLTLYGENAKGIVWAHNTHVGDAAYTSMRNTGEKNIGQLSREKWGAENVFLVGLTTYKGTVMAGREWGAPMQKMNIPKAIKGSVEAAMNKTGLPTFYVLFSEEDRKEKNLKVMGHRAVGVVYNPRNDRRQFVPSLVSLRYDALLFFAETNALKVLK